jgi:23S rRNA (uracil1939-C5)-methyltransferase
MVVLIVNEKSFKNKSQFVKELVKLSPEITTVVLNENSRKTNVILGEREEVLFGPGFIYDVLCGLKFKISSKSFYQTNPIQTEVLYNLAISKANLTKDDVVLDAYCGIGTIGLIVAKHVKEVVGVEIVKEAIVDAKNNAKINNISNTTHICADCSDYMIDKKFDVVFVDPPRAGLDTRFINTLMKKKPKKIVYVSCDVGTLARDLNILSTKYYVRSIDLVDMFPHTRHVESVVYLEAKPDPKKPKSNYGSDYSMYKEKNRGSKTSRNICDSHWDGA